MTDALKFSFLKRYVRRPLINCVPFMEAKPGGKPIMFWPSVLLVDLLYELLSDIARTGEAAKVKP